MVDQRRVIDIVADHERHDPLTEIRIADADHRRLGDTGVGQQRGLDLARTNLEATGLDDVDRLSPDDAMEATRVDHCGVASSEPVAVERGRRGIGAIEVLVEHGRAADLQLADRLAVVAHLAPRVVDQPALDAADGHTDPTRSPLAVEASRHCDQRFGHAVPLDRRLTDQRLHLFEHGNGQRRTARDDQPGSTQCSGQRRLGADARPHGGYPEVHRAIGGRVGLRRRLARVHEAGPHAQRAEHAQHQPVHVEQRQTVHQRVVGRPLPRLGKAVEVGCHRST